MSDAPKIETRVARALYGDNRFHGYSLHGELAAEPLWSLLSLAVGGPRVDGVELRVLDALGSAGAVADPRIWPMKTARIAASYGRAPSGLAAALLFMDDSRIGPWVVGDVALDLLELEEVVGSDISAKAVGDVLETWKDDGRRLNGFGVPARDEDERYTFLAWWYPEHAATGRYWRLLRTAESLLGEKGVRPNVTAAYGAILLDLGYEPDQIRMISIVCGFTCFVANAYEGFTEPAACLRKMPESSVEYVGPAPRRSPRARAAEEGEDDD